MEFNCTVNVVDAVMGSGKSQGAINYMNSHPNERFLYITPYNLEVERIIKNCPDRKFVQPEAHGTKLSSIKKLLSKGCNVASTHALFHRFDRSLIDICRNGNYTLIMDEVTEVIDQYTISKPDYETLMEKYVVVDETSKLLKWRDDEDGYKGKFAEEKRLCDLNCLALYGNQIMMWLFPVEVFNAFHKIFILTYMFDSQIQKYYYDYYGVRYHYLYVAGDTLDTYHFTEEPSASKIKYDYASLIHICDNKSLNEIGEMKYDLCKNWYARNANTVLIDKLRRNLVNYFKNVQKAPSSMVIWTTFKEYQNALSDKGYAKGFLPCTARASNEYRERNTIGYTVNRFVNSFVKKFFEENGVKVDDDGFALSEMIQFIWRSAIREGKEIWVYIPSVRMRNLLIQWINDHPQTDVVDVVVAQQPQCLRNCTVYFGTTSSTLRKKDGGIQIKGLTNARTPSGEYETVYLNIPSSGAEDQVKEIKKAFKSKTNLLAADIVYCDTEKTRLLDVKEITKVYKPKPNRYNLEAQNKLIKKLERMNVQVKEY